MTKKSICLALFCSFLTSILVVVFTLALNERFIDSVKFGWIIFLLIPLLLAIPLSVVAFLVDFLPYSNREQQAMRFLGFFASCLFAPTVGLLIWFYSVPLIGEYQKLTYGVISLGIGATIVGCFVAVRPVAHILMPDGIPRRNSLLFLFLLLLVIPPFGSWLSNRPLSFDEKPHTLMLCLDAATWPIIDRMTERGELPAFQKLQEEGIRFDLESIEPTASPKIWTTIASGVGADKHGMFGMYGTSATVKVPRLWDMVEQNNGSVGLFGWPVTWPPHPVNGFMIPSLFGLGPETYPSELQFIRELAIREKGDKDRDIKSYLIYMVKSIQYGVRLSALHEVAEVIMSRDDYLRNAVALRFLKLRMDSDIFLELWERFDPTFVAFYNNVIDVCCHGFWKYYEPEAFQEVTNGEVMKYGEIIPEAYRRIDRAIGDILRFPPNNLNVIVVSDHGQEAVKTSESGTVRFVLTEKFLETLNLDDLLVGINITSHASLHSKNGSGEFPEEARQLIGGVTVEETGEPIFKLEEDGLGNLNVSVLFKPELGNNHLLLPGGKRIEWKEIIEEAHAERSGEHNLNAILLLKGPAIKEDQRDGQVSILDVAPTVLYMMGYPISESMVGRVLQEAFDDEHFQNNPPGYSDYEFIEQSEEGDATKRDENRKEILKSLGYLL